MTYRQNLASNSWNDKALWSYIPKKGSWDMPTKGHKHVRQEIKSSISIVITSYSLCSNTAIQIHRTTTTKYRCIRWHRKNYVHNNSRCSIIISKIFEALPIKENIFPTNRQLVTRNGVVAFKVLISGLSVQDYTKCKGTLKKNSVKTIKRHRV